MQFTLDPRLGRDQEYPLLSRLSKDASGNRDFGSGEFYDRAGKGVVILRFGLRAVGLG